MKVTLDQLDKANLPNTALFYSILLQNQTHEIGSSSFSPKMADSCTEIRELMLCKFNTVQQGADFNTAFAAMGDTSGCLYFGGYIHTKEGRVKISAFKYFELLATVVEELSEKTRIDLEKISESFVRMESVMEAVRAGEEHPDVRKINLDF